MADCSHWSTEIGVERVVMFLKVLIDADETNPICNYMNLLYVFVEIHFPFFNLCFIYIFYIFIYLYIYL
jgi:hypothetical protein